MEQNLFNNCIFIDGHFFVLKKFNTRNGCSLCRLFSKCGFPTSKALCEIIHSVDNSDSSYAYMESYLPVNVAMAIRDYQNSFDVGINSSNLIS